MVNAGVRLQRSPALDGIRACAVLLVMAYHAGGLKVPGGHIGVNIFFVLSGFLITSLLLQETTFADRINFGNFYIRRILRLYPALIALAIFIVAFSYLNPNAVGAEQSKTGWIPATLYFTNWVRAFGELGDTGFFEHTWSLSIEEQFYLIWPLVIWLAWKFAPRPHRIKTIGAIAAAGCIGSLTTRLVIAPGAAGYNRIFNGTDTQGDQLLFGCLLAVIVVIAVQTNREATLRKVFRILLPIAVVFLVVMIFTWPHHAVTPLYRTSFTGVGIAAACITGYCYLSPRSTLSRSLATKVPVYVGQRSYALYLWHYPIFLMLPDLEPRQIVFAPIGFALAFVAAELSHRLIESPFLRIKNKLRRREEQVEVAYADRAANTSEIGPSDSASIPGNSRRMSVDDS